MHGWEDRVPAVGSGWRSQANVVAVVLLAGMVLAGATVVVYMGTQAIDQRQDRASFEQARQSMQSLGASIDRVSNRGIDAELSLSTMRTGEVTLDPSAGTMELFVNGALENETDLGTVRYEQDGRTLAYQGGGIFETGETGGSAVVSAPPVTYREVDGSATLTLPIVNLTGGTVDSQVDISRTNLSSALADTDLLTDGGSVTVRVQSEFYRAWGSVLEAQLDVGVSYDDSANAVSFTLEAAPDTRTLGGDISGAVVSPGSVGSIANHGNFDSYDDVYQGTADQNGQSDISASDRHNGDIRIDGEVKFEKQDVAGDVHATGGLADDTGWKFRISGDLVLGTASGTTEIDGKANGNMKTEIRGELSTKTDLVVKEAAEIGGIIANGTVDVSGVSGGVTGDVHAHGDTVIESDVGGDVIVDGDVTINDSTVNGKIRASGSVTLNNAAVIEGVDQNADVSGELDDPLEATVPTFKSATDLIKDIESEYKTNENNDNADKPGLINNSASAWDSFACSSSCRLDHGEYYVEGLHFSGDLTIDTSGGDVHVFVDDYVNVQGTITVEGDGQLFIYLDGDDKHGQVNQHFAIDGTVETRDDIDGDGVSERSYNATKVWTYAEPDSSVGFSTDASYTGVLYGADDSGTGADYSFSNHANVFGAVIGVLDDVNNHPAIHYDERLASAAASPGGGGGGGGGSGSSATKPNVIHIEASERTVKVR